MLCGSRLDDALEHVDGSRYALVHAVSKRARQITLWLTADPAELRSEDAPPPAPREFSLRDPVALAEAEILDGEVTVQWNPDGSPEERELPDTTVFEADPLLLELEDDEVMEAEEDDAAGVATTLVEALEAVASGEADTIEETADASIVDAETADAVEDVDNLLDGDGDIDANVDVEIADED
ncbi:MAG: DNA-directed RNA polymerase subunit omega [Actinobacteria bacterium]|nr:DNA-directed RNA polymerase subunit omega [Actinomycetota bacterium]